jgi:ABC-2 type transport system ATP-binding protein
MQYAIATHRLTKYYGPRAVVRDLELRVPRGCVYGLLGRNGAGKSTALKMLMGMVRPDYGQVELLGEDLHSISPQTRGRIAYLAEGHPLYTGMTIGQAIAFTRPFYPRWNGRLVERVLDHFELPLRKRIGRLSKGQRAQVSLTLALAPEPELLVLDDPTLGLDTNVRHDFLESMVHLIQRQGRSILLSSHILADVERIADRVGVMIDGVLRVDCPTEHFKRSVRKVVVEFSGAIPELPELAGLIGDAQFGARRELVFVGYGRQQQAALEALGPSRLEEIDLDLEEAFIEYTRGPRRRRFVLDEEAVA